MLDAKQLKVLGLRFARSLQMAFKSAITFSADHRSTQRPIQHSFELLNDLLKEGGRFTFGFVDKQVLLNNILTTEHSLVFLETEFLKRGIAAVTFEPGLTLGRFHRVLGSLTASTKTIEDAGGLRVYLEENQVEGARVLPAAKSQKKDEQGDTVIETDSEQWILSKQMEEDDEAPDNFMDSIDALLESACYDTSTRTELLSTFATSGTAIVGEGVPIAMPNFAVLREGQEIGDSPMAKAEGSSSESARSGNEASGSPVATGETPGGSGQYSGGGSRGGGWLVGREGGSQAGAGSYVGGPGESGGGGAGSGQVGTHPGGGGEASYPGGNFGATGHFGTGTGSGDPALAGSGEARTGSRPGLGQTSSRSPVGQLGGQRTFMELMENSIERSLLEEKGNPRKSYMALARIMRDMGVEKILTAFPAERREALSGMQPEQLAAEYIEDTALHWAGTMLASPKGKTDKFLVEEDVLRVLAQSLKATQNADQLAHKLVKFIEEYAVPPHIQEKIRDELRWTTLDHRKKYSRLMETKLYSSIEFRRLMEFLKQLLKDRDIDRAGALALHYFDFLDEEGVRIEPTELSRATELIRSILQARVEFVPKTIERLSRTLLREDLSEVVHFQAASALTVLAQSVVAFEDFDSVLAVGLALEKSRKPNPEKHKRCCGAGLGRLLPPLAIERIIELFLSQRDDSSWGKRAATLIRFAVPASVENVLSHLIEEKDAKNRLALLRLISKLGPEAAVASRRYLEDDRWYVVRNMCMLLADLHDPEIETHLATALQHSDPRVQEAAFNALLKARSAGRGKVLAAALPKLAPNILERALDELMFLKDVHTVAELEKFIVRGHGTAATFRRIIKILSCIPRDETLHALTTVFRTRTLDLGSRRIALTAILTNPSPGARRCLQQLDETRDPQVGDPLAEELHAALAERPHSAHSHRNHD